jgi:tripartite-type tricarboxylate transporter receptor subunit TctC
MLATVRPLSKLLLASLVLLCAGAAQAQAYPTKPIRFVVGFAPGGSIDAIARILAAHLTKKLGQPVTVENKTGANGVISGVELARAQPDGYTVLISNSSMITVTPLLSRKPQYDVEKDFAPVSLIASFPFILMVNPDSEKTASIASLADLVSQARAKPGQFTYGSNGGPGNLAHLSFELLDRMAGTRMVNVPYRGAAESQMALLSKNVDFTFDNPSVMPQIVAGKLKPLAVSTPRRWRDLPAVPTIDELGYKGFDTSAWAGAFVRAGTPPETVRILYDAIRSAGDDEEMRAKLKPYGELHMFDPEQFAARIKAEAATYAEIIKSANIQLQD